MIVTYISDAAVFRIDTATWEYEFARHEFVRHMALAHQQMQGAIVLAIQNKQCGGVFWPQRLSGRVVVFFRSLNFDFFRQVFRGHSLPLIGACWAKTRCFAGSCKAIHT